MRSGTAEPPPLSLVATEKPPSAPKRETHTWADWVELRCLMDPDGLVTPGQVAAWLREDPQEVSDEDASDDEAGETSQVQDSDYVVTDQEAARGTAARVRAPQRVDSRALRATDYFAVLRARAGELAGAYPFTVDAMGIQRQVDPNNAVQRLYVFLLLAAQLRVVAERRRTYLTATFEHLMVPALESLLPGARVQLFGTTAEQGGRYRGSLRTKIKRLAEDLNERPGRGYDSIGPHDRGDAGLDVVAEIPVGDNRPGRFVVFLQAACTERWVEKQHSCAPSAWRQRLPLTNPQMTVCGVPFYLRTALGDWHDYNDLQDRLILDRPRIIHLLTDVEGSCPPRVRELVDGGLAGLLTVDSRRGGEWAGPATAAH